MAAPKIRQQQKPIIGRTVYAGRFTSILLVNQNSTVSSMTSPRMTFAAAHNPVMFRCVE